MKYFLLMRLIDAKETIQGDLSLEQKFKILIRMMP